MSAAPLEYPPPKHRRPQLTFYRYFAREALWPSLFALLGLTVVVLTTSFFGYSELVVNHGVGAAEVGSMAFWEAVPVAGRMFPFAVLVGCLVALGRLGADREILILEASGVAAARLVWPVVSFAGVMSLLALLLSVYATPWANRSFDRVLDEISRTKPWAQLRANTVNRFGGWQLEAREVSSTGEELTSVMLYVPELGETLFSRSGTLGGGDGGAVEITLHDSAVVLRPKGTELRLLRFDTVTTLLPDSDRGLMRSEEDRIPGLPLDELMRLADSWESGRAATLPAAALALQRRFAYPAATLVFGFLTVPLFLARGRYSRSSGGVIGLIATLAYYGLMQLAEGLVQGGTIGPVLGAWLPNLVLTGVAVGLLVRALRSRVASHVFDRPRVSARASAEGPGRVRSHRYALARYVGVRFLQLVGLSFAVLFVAYFLIDLMDRLRWFAQHEATAIEVVRFYGARAWLLASRAVPMALLVATALVVSLLAVEGELIGMRACGISAPRALLPVLALAATIAPLYFLLNNVVVPRTTALADDLKQTEIKDHRTRERRNRLKVGFWVRSGTQLLQADFFDPDRGQTRDLTVFGLGEDGLPTSRTDAASGRHIGQGWWRLDEPSRVDLEAGALVRVPAPRHAYLGETLEVEIDTMHMPASRIAEEARAVEADGFDATPFWVDFQVRLAEPLACLVLPALVFFFSVTGPPFPGPAQTLLVSAVVGVAYILLAAVSSSFGRSGALSPVLAAWGPILLFGFIAGALSVRVLRRM